MNTTQAVRAQSRTLGFTLIEVLIAILILGLGLLGLGAVFPAVIAQQRNAVGVVEGESVASMAEAIVTSSPEIIDFTPWFDPTSTFGRDGTTLSDPVTYEWVVPPFNPFSGYGSPPGFEGFLGSQDGRWFMELDAGLNPVPDITTPDGMRQVLTVADRLIPQPYSGKDPKYVWDLVARREPSSNRPQLAIFIRQVDQRIRVPINATLSDVLVLSAGTAAGDPAIPVAIDSTNGRPVFDSKGDYSDDIVYAAPQTLQVQVVSDHLDWLIIEDANNPFIDTSISFATRPGQKLLDNTGTVRTVLGPATGPDTDLDDTRIIRVDPPFKPSHAVSDTASYDAGNNDPENAGLPNEAARIAARASWLRQIVFTPRTPLAIRVVTLEENSP